MKKFTNISGTQVGKEPQIVEDKDLMTIELLRNNLLKLMDDLLTIRSYGSARAELLNGALSISGKEDLVAAILDLIGDQNLRVKIDAMESLRFGMKDQLLLDNKVFEFSNIIECKKSLRKKKNIVSKISRFVENNQMSWDFELLSEKFVSRIDNKNSANENAEVIGMMLKDEDYKYLDSEKLNLLRNFYLERAKNL
jgi:hypothetical protein